MFGSRILTRRQGPVDSLPPRLIVRGTSSSVMPRATEETVRGLPPYRRGQRLISRTIGMLPLVLERNGVLTDETLPLMDRPVPWMSRQAAVESIVETVLDYGNYFALLTQFDQLGRAQGIIPVHPRDVAVSLTPAGLVYRMAGQVYGSADVLHIRTGGPAGDLLGRGVLETSATAIATAKSIAGASSYFYSDGVYPAGVLQVDNPDLSADDAEQLRDLWTSKVRRGQPVVLPSTTEWKPVVSPNAEQAQLAAAANLSRREVADLLDLDGDWLGVPGNSMTYANIVDRVDNLVRFTCQPTMVAIEDAFTALTSRPTRVRFDTEELFRAQTTQRYADYAVALSNRILTLDEVRAEEGRPPLPVDAAAATAPPGNTGLDQARVAARAAGVDIDLASRIAKLEFPNLAPPEVPNA